MRRLLPLLALLAGCGASVSGEEPVLDDGGEQDARASDGAGDDAADASVRSDTSGGPATDAAGDGRIDATTDAPADGAADTRVVGDAATDTSTVKPDSGTGTDTGTVADTGTKTDTGTLTDTGTKTDTGTTDAGAKTCPATLASTFACVAPTAKKGKKTCSEAMVQAIVPACYGSSATATKCADVQKKYPGCQGCILSDWLDGGRPDIAACILAITPTSPCGPAMNCGYDCLDAVCGACSTAAGSGAAGGTARAECFSAQSKSTGQCWSKGMSSYASCSGTAQFALCFPATTADLIPFFRGACRDGGDWSRALSP